MNTQAVTEAAAQHERRSARVWTISLLGPAVVVAGLVWAVLQPYRITFLHPHGQGFWWLAVEPPILVVVVGVVFHFLVAPGVLEDLDAVEREEG